MTARRLAAVLAADIAGDLAAECNAQRGGDARTLLRG